MFLNQYHLFLLFLKIVDGLAIRKQSPPSGSSDTDSLVFALSL